MHIIRTQSTHTKKRCKIRLTYPTPTEQETPTFPKSHTYFMPTKTNNTMLIQNKIDICISLASSHYQEIKSQLLPVYQRKECERAHEH